MLDFKRELKELAKRAILVDSLPITVPILRGERFSDSTAVHGAYPEVFTREPCLLAVS